MEMKLVGKIVSYDFDADLPYVRIKVVGKSPMGKEVNGVLSFNEFPLELLKELKLNSSVSVMVNFDPKL
jgi:hypothetical protein